MRRNAKPRNPQGAHEREVALTVLASMRRARKSLRAAAKEHDMFPRTVLRYVGSAITQKRGRYEAKPYDRIPRRLNFLTPRGPTSLTVRDSRTASRIAEYMNAVRKYVNTGESSALRQFRGRAFQAARVKFRFVTDPSVVERLADAGVLAFEQLYRAAQGMTN